MNEQDGQVAHLAIVPINTSVTRLGTRWDLCDKSGIRHTQLGSVASPHRSRGAQKTWRSEKLEPCDHAQDVRFPDFEAARTAPHSAGVVARGALACGDASASRCRSGHEGRVRGPGMAALTGSPRASTAAREKWAR